ncbi:MAG: HAMP domain-containing histidine kinase [Rickettsiales bacterium]|nr:HAMP domain-containing histidine kinase [Rickettsiales bacterium]
MTHHRYNDKDVRYSNLLSMIPCVVHEVKNPLNAIIGFSEIIKMSLNKTNSKEDCEEYINDIQEVAYDLNEMLGDLLYFFKKESFSNFSIDLNNRIDVSDVINKSIKINRDFAFRSHINIKVEIEDNLPQVYLDKRRLKQVMINLINNAIKYSPNNTTVHIKAFVKNDKLIIVVKDQGHGIDEKDLTSIFTKFNSTNHKNISESFGLGLSVVKELVEAQNGIVSVNSQSGKGSEFILEFRL